MISLIEEFFSNFYQIPSSKFRYRSQKSEKLVWRLADFYVEQSQKRGDTRVGQILDFDAR